ncbi:hypothetical protein GOV14_03080 [Candidatus Pacearchaeota archaeon]|nr:hypothetical protein [Candidatus Pacearchaeota archaeon]
MKCIIVHGCPPNTEKFMGPEARTYDKHWIPWIKEQLNAKSINIKTPLMPDPWEPNYESWKKIIDELDVNEETVLIGHSCGGGFLVRYLGETKKKVKKLILIAPAIIHSREYKPLNDLLKFEINPEVKNLTNDIVIFVSDNDSKGIIKSAEIFSQTLDCRVKEFKGYGHFTQDDMGTIEFPELLTEIIN